ncbi:uncharacterized protein B0H18DRAFT_969572 [Fomitopsis serialis]|uniref:uncharacterized protein n=1 Tax=Fomitopsis serialis TaxID=139415 RepID=UPI00200855F8|nr:uncharacterized protein B0H18DRAFT_969572 [Neoantrodia serialis]KAH9937207.1 hypothetical protein B0H18DRAFT_969572 [Neoantrodia serialis]
MINHAASLVPSLSASFPSILFAAASRAWSRTRPARAPLRGSVRGHATASEPRRQDSQEVHRDDDAFAEDAEQAGPSTPLLARLAVHDGVASDIMTHGGPIPRFSPKRAKLGSPSRNGAQQQDVSTDVVDSTAENARHPKGRPPRSLVWRNPWSIPVTDVHVDSLPVRELFALDLGRDLNSYETDPPWPEIAEALSASRSRPCVVHYGPFVYSPNASVPWPTSSEDLHRKLDHFQSLSPPPSLEWLIRYHARFRQHHSTETFNVLLRLAIRMARRKTAESLFIQMEKEAISPDLLTRQLRVRFLVRLEEGWERAWAEQTGLAREQDKPLPLAVWVEFFGTEKRGAIRKWRLNDDLEEYALKPVKPVDRGTLQSRYRRLMQGMPTLTPHEMARVPTAVVYNTVGNLILMDQLELAFKVTESFFLELPDRLEPSLHDRCLAIIHLHLTPSSPRGLKGHFALRRLVYQFLSMHHGLRPNATTLYLLMRPLLRTRGGGSAAEELVKTFVHRWGRSIVDERVRRRVAVLLCQQGQLSRAATVARAQKVVELARRELSTEEEVTSRPARVRKLPAPAPFIFRRRNVERWKWQLLRRRLRRKTLQRRRASRGP